MRKQRKSIVKPLTVGGGVVVAGAPVHLCSSRGTWVSCYLYLGKMINLVPQNYLKIQR